MRSDATRNDAAVAEPTDTLSKPRIRLPRWQIVALVVGFALVQVAIVVGQQHYDSSRRTVGNRRALLSNSQLQTNRAHICRLIDTIAPGKSPIVDQFRTSPYPVAMVNGRFIYQPYCPTP